MPKRRWTQVKFLLLAGLLFVPGLARAQKADDGDHDSRAAAAPRRPAAKPLPAEHPFWDRENVELFAGVAAVRALDYASTRHFRARGANEILLSNAIVDNHPLFAGIEAAATAASIGVSYLLHRKGHHKLERWVSIVHIGVGAAGDARNYTLGNHPPNP